MLHGVAKQTKTKQNKQGEEGRLGHAARGRDCTGTGTGNPRKPTSNGRAGVRALKPGQCPLPLLCCKLGTCHLLLPLLLRDGASSPPIVTAYREVPACICHILLRFEAEPVRWGKGLQQQLCVSIKYLWPPSSQSCLALLIYIANAYDSLFVSPLGLFGSY